MPLIDLSPPISQATPHWPGDQGFTSSPRWSIAAGEPVTVATLSTTGHIGAHIDAPSHVTAQGATVEQTPIDACIGACVIVDVTTLVRRDRTPHGFAPADALRERLAAILGHTPVERLLLRHRDPAAAAASGWDDRSPGLDPEFVRWFGAQGGRLLGIDLDSFDPLASKDLPAHHAAIEAGIVMLEGLALGAAPEGAAELFALPIPWVGADAAPVRAVIRI